MFHEISETVVTCRAVAAAVGFAPNSTGSDRRLIVDIAQCRWQRCHVVASCIGRRWCRR